MLNLLKRITTGGTAALLAGIATIACTTKPEESPAVSVVAMAAAAESPRATLVTVYKDPNCGCCNNWIEHLREHGFQVVTHDTREMNDVKSRLGVGAALASCHTAVVDGYVVEGHVPADDIRRLLAERPKVAGLAVPGMPMGSPGMEGPRTDRYDVVAFEATGATRVFSSH